MPPAESATSTAASQAARIVPPPAKRLAPAPVIYPESDGKPMAETPWHGDVMYDLSYAIRDRYAHRKDVFMGRNMLAYYEEGNPRKSVSPDVFMAFGVPERSGPPPVWKTWEEGKLADFVLEVTSKSTRRDDEGRKKALYAQLGVTEYWMYDPTGDYLKPILKGYRLRPNHAYSSIALREWGGGVEAQIHFGTFRFRVRRAGDGSDERDRRI